MLFLRKPDKVDVIRVPLGAGAYIDVLPAMSHEVDEAIAKVRLAVAGLISGSEAAAGLAPLLGDEFALAGEVLDDAKIAAASERLTGIYLVMECQRGWGGIGLDETREAVSEPDVETIALLLNDPARRQLIMTAVNARVHVETAEGNGLPVSPNGGAGIPHGAPNAGPAESPAPTAAASSTVTAH